MTTGDLPDMELLMRHGFALEAIAPCGGVWAMLGQIVNAHLAVHGRGKRLLYRMINRFALWLDHRFPDEEETLLWMCVARKPTQLLNGDRFTPRT